MRICCKGATHWRGSLGPSRIAGHDLSRSMEHPRCVRSQAPAANGSRSYFHRRHQNTREQGYTAWYYRANIVMWIAQGKVKGRYLLNITTPKSAITGDKFRERAGAFYFSFVICHF